ncbi:DNA-protecting protein DprA [Pseudomethylobacillus aquaticus]|uniref:DNA-protecting protein DprA n=2 Tax=Pseudomethylobacillus aquaticus TaxID=2676064 RepID=A0A3N0UZ88_9PROT|nr:DNA-processing protein DprA [Pseudomethylobacillus aquaticus]ROH85813.1 DNA-protecting protein DprA [Pseudomethylobacillus aquaticus]
MSMPLQDEQALWIALSRIPGLGSRGICQLLQQFGEPAHIFAAKTAQLRDVVSDAVADAIRAGPNLDDAATTLQWLQQAGNHLITLADAEYPQALLEIPDPPALLYGKGQLALLKRPALAVVGSRNATPQGIKNAEAFARALGQQGHCIVSGLALGIDGAAHRGALDTPGGTIAVVGTGLDIVYPSRHLALARQIVEHGLLLSEFPLGTPSRAAHFPQRNRLISGLSRGCLVVEANLHSGSLITARLAAEQGREVFAMPGSIHSPLSKGCHQLIKQGAKLVDDLADILSEIRLNEPVAGTEVDTNGTVLASNKVDDPGQQLLEIMGFDPISLEALLDSSGLTSDSLSAMLLVLELESKVATLPGGRYQRIT